MSHYGLEDTTTEISSTAQQNLPGLSSQVIFTVCITKLGIVIIDVPKQQRLHLSLSKHSLLACSSPPPLVAPLSHMYSFTLSFRLSMILVRNQLH